MATITSPDAPGRARRYHCGRAGFAVDTLEKPTSRRFGVAVIAAAICGIAVAGCGTSDSPAFPSSGTHLASGITSVPTAAPLTTATTTTLAATTATTARPVSTTAPPTTAAPATAAPPTAAAPTTAPPTTAAPTTAAPTTTVPPCPDGIAAHLSWTGQATQLFVVEAAGYGTTAATATLWQRQGRCWVAAAGPWPATLGANGFTDNHQEGDNSTPTGAYSIASTMYGNQPNPGVRYAYHRLVCGDWWDEDSSSPEYNTFQHVACGQTPPFGGGSEALWQETTAYPSFAVVNFNTSPVVAGKGSGIFIHADVGGPTAGCVSLPLGDLDHLLDWLNPAASPLVVMGPASEIGGF